MPQWSLQTYNRHLCNGPEISPTQQLCVTLAKEQALETLAEKSKSLKTQAQRRIN